MSYWLAMRNEEPVMAATQTGISSSLVPRMRFSTDTIAIVLCWSEHRPGSYERSIEGENTGTQWRAECEDVANCGRRKLISVG